MVGTLSDAILAAVAVVCFVSMLVSLLVAVRLSAQLTRAEKNLEVVRREVRRTFESAQEPLGLFGESGGVLDLQARQRRRTQ